MTGYEVLLGLARAVREDGGLLADAIRDPALDALAPHGTTTARGPRAAGRVAELALVVEAVREGYLLHYVPSCARIVDTTDPDLALLAGDRLYALGLARLAEMGDLEAVGELTDVIALSAGAHAAGADDLAEAVWEAGAVAVGWGADEALESAKARARTIDPSAADALRAAARQVVQDRAR